MIMPQWEYLVIIAGMGLVTYVPRWAPLAVLSRRRLPQWLLKALDLIPAAVLSALVLPAIVTTGDPRSLSLLQPEMIAAVPTFLFALKTRSLGGTVVFGMGLFWVLEKFVGL